MMTDLDDQATVDALLERFSGFYDAVLVGVVLDLPRTRQDRRAALRILAEERAGSWRTVVLSIKDLREFKFEEGRTSHLVLSDGLGIHLLQDGIFVDLAPYTEAPVSPEALPRSHMYAFGGSCSFEVTEVRE